MSSSCSLERTHMQPSITVQTSLPQQRHNTKNLKQLLPEKKLLGHSPNFCIHVSVSDLCISRIDLRILLQENMWTDPGNIYAHRQMNVEIRTEDAQFPEKEFTNGISIAVYKPSRSGPVLFGFFDHSFLSYLHSSMTTSTFFILLYLLVSPWFHVLKDYWPNTTAGNFNIWTSIMPRVDPGITQDSRYACTSILCII